MFLFLSVNCIRNRLLSTSGNGYQYTQTNTNHNPPRHSPVSDLSHPVPWTVSVTMSCVLWQFSPSGWSIGPYGAIQGHREEGDEEYISSISKTEFMSPWALVNHNLLLWKNIDYKIRQIFFTVAMLSDHTAQIFLSVPIHYLGHTGSHLKSKNYILRQRPALSS